MKLDLDNIMSNHGKSEEPSNNSTQPDSFSLTEEQISIDNVLQKIEDDGNDFLILSGITDSSTVSSSGSSSVIDNISTAYADMVTENIAYSEPSEGFNEYEIDVLKQIVFQTSIGETEKSIYKELLPLTQEASELEKWYSSTALKKRSFEAKFLEDTAYVEANVDRIRRIISYRDGNDFSGNLLTEDERENPQRYILDYDDKIRSNREAMPRIEELEKALERQSAMIEAKNAEIRRRYEELLGEAEQRVQSQSEDFSQTLSKITEIEFGHRLREKGANFEVYARCQCGAISPHNLSSMMSVIIGDAFYDFKKRTYVDSEVKANRFNKKSKDLRGAPTMYKLLEEEGDEKYRRIVIPGVSNNDVGMTCPGCNKNMVPPVHIIDRLRIHGFLGDTYSLEASKNNRWKASPITPGEYGLIYGGKQIWDGVYTEDLYQKPDENAGGISSDFRVRDNQNYDSAISLSENDKRILVIYSNATIGTKIDARMLKNDIEGIKRAIISKRKELISKLKPVPVSPNLDEDKYIKLAEKNRINRSITTILNSNELIEMCITRRISPSQLGSIVKPNNKESLAQLQAMLNEYTITRLINHPILPTLENQNGEWIVTSTDIYTPHFKFFLMYKESLKKYTNFISDQAGARDKYIYLEEVFKIVNTYVVGGVPRVAEMEEKLRDLREDMEHILAQTRETELNNFLDKFGYQALVDEDNFAPCWLVADLRIMDVDTIEPRDINLFNTLYPSN